VTIHLTLEGPLARVTLARPDVLNAANADWVRDLNDVVARLAQAPEVRVVVITGAGRAFCTGVDLDALAAGTFGLSDFVAWEDAMTAIERMDRLFVAGINGYCLGGGLQLALPDAAFLVRVDDVAVGPDAQQDVLDDAGFQRDVRDLLGLLDTEDRHHLGPHPHDRAEVAARDLHEVADVAHREPEPVQVEGVLGLDGDGRADPRRERGAGDDRVAVVVLGHEVQLDADALRLAGHHARVVPDRIEVDHVRVRREHVLGVQPRGGPDESGVAGGDRVEIHGDAS
jgi:hypothetical protein